MTAKTHATILKIIMAIGVLGGILLLVRLFTTKDVPELYCIPLIAVVCLWFLVLSLAPVRCHVPGCKGRMRTNWIKESDATERLQYVCSSCGEIFDTDINFSWGDPYQHQPNESSYKMAAHSLRRTLPAWLSKNGLDIIWLQHLLGHENIETTKHYVGELDVNDVARFYEVHAPLRDIKR